MRLIDVNASFGPIPHGDAPSTTADELLVRMDELAIDVSLAHHALARHYDPRLGNQLLLEEASERPRILPVATLVPLEARSVTVEQQAQELAERGFAAVRVFPVEHAWRLGGPEGRAVARCAARARLPLLVDLGQTSWECIETTCRREPELPVVVGHAGYRCLRPLLPLLEELPNLHVDLSYFAANEAVELLARRGLGGRLLFGTGTPVSDAAGALGRLAWSGLDRETRELVGHGTVRRLANIDRAGHGSTAGDRLAGAGEALRSGSPLELDVVDPHGHLGSWYAFELPEPGVDSILRVLDRCGVDQLAISSLRAIGPDPAGGNAETLAAARDHPERLRAYLVADPRRPEDADELEAQLRDPLVVGLKVHPDTHVCPADGKEYEWVWELARRVDAPVLAHCFSGTPTSDPAQYGNVLDRYPALRLIVAHAGVTPAGFRACAELGQRHQGFVVDTCGSYMTGAWVRWLVDRLGAHRVLYASDTPFIDLRYGLGRVLGAGLADDVLRAVLAENARSLLQIPRSPDRAQ